LAPGLNLTVSSLNEKKFVNLTELIMVAFFDEKNNDWPPTSLACYAPQMQYWAYALVNFRIFLHLRKPFSHKSSLSYLAKPLPPALGFATA
jgi:hypothetical protein